MKILLFCSVFLFVSFSSYAGDRTEVCKGWSELAEKIMTNRQKGISMSKMMEIADGNSFIEKIVINAYDTPRFQTTKAKKNTIEDFRDEIYLKCIKNSEL